MIHNTKISIIAAMDEKQGIGKENKIPWHISEDFKHFKNITSGHPIVMGRKTFQSIGRILPNRTNIIITHDTNYRVKGAIVVHSLEEVLDESSKYHVLSSKYDPKDKKIHDTKY